MNQIRNRLEKAREQYCFSGYQLYFKRGESSAQSLSGGSGSYWAGGRKVSELTLFDIGSVTKAVVTTSLIALGVDRGELRLEDRLGHFFSEFLNTPLNNLSIQSLLNHSAGLSWWHPIAAQTTKSEFIGWSKENSRQLCERSAGEKGIYSDVGFFLLGAVIEKIWGELSSVFLERVASPLGLKSVTFGPVDTANCVATEFHLVERRLLHGEVFDDNARGWGGIAAHAGLFSSAAGLAPWAQAWLKSYRGESDWLSQKTAKLFATKANLVSNSSWALGWDTKSTEGSSAGTLFSPTSFGHLGFTGCSVWIDPEKNGFAIFLTNRVHPSRLDERIRQIRPWVHDEVARTW